MRTDAIWTALDGIRSAARDADGVTHVDTHVVWDPAWHPGMIAPNAFPG